MTATTQRPPRSPVIIAMVPRERGITGVHTHVRQLRTYLQGVGEPIRLVTPHTWAEGSRGRAAALLPLFGARVALERTHGPTNVRWYRTSHEHVLRAALRRTLAGVGPCVVYAQCPVSARAALDARTGPHQRVVLAVHFRISQADEWADKGQITRDGAVYRWIRDVERSVVPRVDGLVFVSAWAREALLEWMPEADQVRHTVIPNFVNAPASHGPTEVLGDLVSVGNLEAVKNHRFLLHVLAAARRAGRTYTLDVFGEGVERSRLLALADQLGLRDQVHLRGFRADAQDCLPGYRAYVHASYSESSSLAIMEAMAAGLPVLSSPVGALHEIFDDPDQGRFWPIDDPDGAARILMALMDDAAELRRCGRAARAAFTRRYDAALVAPVLLQFLRESPTPSRLP